MQVYNCMDRYCLSAPASELPTVCEMSKIPDTALLAYGLPTRLLLQAFELVTAPTVF
jgi:hypothetical protein